MGHLKKRPVPQKKTDDVKDEEDERQAILDNLYKVHEELTNAQKLWSERKDALLGGKTREELGLPNDAPPPITQEQKHELGVSLVTCSSSTTTDGGLST